MLIEAKLPLTYWGEAMMTATYLQNRLPNRTRARTSYELSFEKKPNLSHLKVFGCKVFAQIPKEKRHKLDSKAREYTLVGYPEGSKGYRLLDKSTGKIIVSRNVTFLEADRTQKEGKDQDSCDFQLLNSEIYSKNIEPNQQIIYFPCDITDDNDNLTKKKDKSSVPAAGPGEDSSQPPDDYHSVSNQDETSNDIANLQSTSIDHYIYDNECEYNEAEPKTYEEAINGPHSKEWINLINKEINSLRANNTWTLEPVPKNEKMIDCKWVFKMKLIPEEIPSRFKARLVAQGFSQKYGSDFDKVFAPVVKVTTIRAFLCLAGERNYHVRHTEVKTAFLNGHLKEDIYMVQPPGCKDETHSDWGCRLEKFLYDLKQSAKEWYEKLNQVLTEYNFRRGEDDPCRYTHDNNTISYLLIHVDDIPIASASINRVNRIIDALKRQFDLTDLGEVKSYLGIQVKRNQPGDFSIDQSVYPKNIKED